MSYMIKSTDIAKLLLEIKAVTLNLKNPYRYTSGILSPIYCDNRLIISYPDKRKTIIDAFLGLIQGNKLSFDIVAGIAIAGIPHAAWIADRLNKPMVYVRANAKEHGKQNQIEGKIKEGQTAIVVEDLISTGGSAISAALALREAGIEVKDCVAIFNYELEQSAQKFFEAEIQVLSLCDFPTLIDVATKEGYLNEIEKNQALEWNEDPVNWGKQSSVEN